MNIPAYIISVIITTSCSVGFQCDLSPLAVVCSPSAERSGVRSVRSGHGQCIYCLPMVCALICQHKRGRIECLMTRGIFHCSLSFPSVPLFKVQTLFSGPRRNLSRTHGQALLLSREHFKGQTKENCWITCLTK